MQINLGSSNSRGRKEPLQADLVGLSSDWMRAKIGPLSMDAAIFKSR